MAKKEEGWGEEKGTYRKIPKISPGAYIIFSKALLEGLIVGSKFTVFALFYFVFDGNFPSTSPQGAYIWRHDLTEGFLRYWFGGLVHGGAYFWNFKVFYFFFARALPSFLTASPLTPHACPHFSSSHSTVS